MEYGIIPTAALENADIHLPADAAANDMVLKQGRGSTKFYMGTPKWGRKEWVGQLYPKGTKASQFLDQYVKHYNCIELNATHYKIYPPGEIAKWVEKAAARDFQFCPKVIDAISHDSGFVNTGELTRSFLDSVHGLGDKLGPIFLQVSEWYNPKQRDKLFAYLQALPKDLRFFLEVRHPDWFAGTAVRKELFDMLRHLGIGAVITDTLTHRDVVYMELAIPTAFIRFSCHGDHQTDLRRIDDWVARIKSWKEKGLDACYFFVHTSLEGFSPQVTRYVAEKFNRECNANLPEVKVMTMF